MLEVVDYVDYGWRDRLFDMLAVAVMSARHQQRRIDSATVGSKLLCMPLDKMCEDEELMWCATVDARGHRKQ